jgi:hypothetical protein|tara:strand:+ start:5059 stop:6102 length:1044 start_codon:yes stop_codon:yes gene_type:complete
LKVTWYINNFRLKGLDRIKNIIGSYKYNYDSFTTSTWNRCLQLIPYLEKMNIKCSISDGNNLNTDIAVLIRWQDNSAYNLVKRLRDKKVITVLDLCVNYFDETGVFPGGYGVNSNQVEVMKKLSVSVNGIIAGSEYIKQRAKHYNPNSIYLPESIDYNHFNFVKSKKDYLNNYPRAIWSGQSVKSSEVADLYPKLKERGIPLTIISNMNPEMPGPYIYLPWSYYTFPKNILNGEFCVSPRATDNTYDLGHSHFKIGVFMAQGIPALAAPLPSYKEVIEKTGGGKLCESDEEWEKALDELLENRKMLWKWSQAALEGMKEYSTELVAKKYKLFFEKLLNDKKREQYVN